MSRWPWVSQSLLSALVLLIGGSRDVAGQEARRAASPPQKEAASLPRPELIVLNAIRANPVTAPYFIRTTWRKGAVELSGRVGTKQVHDVAVRLAIDCGIPFRDNLVIDTGAAHAVAGAETMATPAASALAQEYTSSPYIYPPPLMGRLDDPFFGFSPPLVSFPPWWQRRVESGPMVKPRRAQDDTTPANATTSNASGPNHASTDARWKPFEIDPVKGHVEITVDAAGQVFLRGVVASEEVRREIEEEARSVPGVTRVESQFQVQPRRVEGDPPPPPVPQGVPSPSPPDRGPKTATPAAVQTHPKPSATTTPVAQDAAPLTRRVVGAIEQRPEAADLAVKVRSNDGVVTLSGQVPTAYEAMLVYRTAQKTPGVRDIVDRLEFEVPDEDHANPLLQKGRPEDIEPYLGSQVRRHVAELAHLDRIQLQGDVVELRGTLLHAADQNRVLAILRSIPVLQGFRLEPVFTAN
jgi:BON domain